ncbi:MAG: hypothetical protein LKJ45_02600 [Oscillospiraceae bacterium]|nr:hypothetical protein [Oscillospiraceae bacterium]
MRRKGRNAALFRSQRAAGWCEAVRIPREITLEQEAENAAASAKLSFPGFSAVTGKRIAGCAQRCRTSAAD